MHMAMHTQTRMRTQIYTHALGSKTFLIYEKHFQNQLLPKAINFQMVDFYQNICCKLGSTLLITLHLPVRC